VERARAEMDEALPHRMVPRFEVDVAEFMKP
jgi:hypothetical protein